MTLTFYSKERKVKKGDKYRIKIRSKIPSRWNPDGLMNKYMGQVVTIKNCYSSTCVRIEEDQHDGVGAGGWTWCEEDFELINKINDPNTLFKQQRGGNS